MPERILVSNVITKYNLVKPLFVDILFQHGIDKIYFYGIEGSDNEFVHHVSKSSKTFGFPSDRPELYEPLQMIELGAKYNAHVDLDYERYRGDLDQWYEWADTDKERNIVSRIIGMFEPNEVISVPILDVTAVKVEVTKKTLSEKISDVENLYNYLGGSKPYKKYRSLMYKMGTVAKLDDATEKTEEMSDTLKDVIDVAGELSKPIGIALKAVKVLAYFLVNRKEKKFNPLLLNLETFRTQAALSALSRVRIVK